LGTSKNTGAKTIGFKVEDKNQNLEIFQSLKTLLLNLANNSNIFRWMSQNSTEQALKRYIF